MAVTASGTDVADRRRIELVEPGVTPAPIHYDSAKLTVAQTTALVKKVRASVASATNSAFDELERAVSAQIVSISLRELPANFPADIETQRQSPWEARADAVMYRQILAELAGDRGWTVHFYDAKRVEAQAAEMLGGDEALKRPRRTLGPPWAKDHRVALAAIILHTGPTHPG